MCDRHGRRWLADWRGDAERLGSKAPRVRVSFRQLQRWYRSLDQLLALKPKIEQELFFRLRDLFSLEVDLVLYDLTSTYFEGQGPPELARNGHSRDQKPRNRQVLVGLVMVDGWPIAHHVFAGNGRDAMTVPAVLDDLDERFGLARVVFVGDRGMVTAANLALLRQRGQGYIVNTASFAGLYPYAINRIPYAASKAALVSVTRYLARDLGPSNVRVNCVSAGPLTTVAAKGIAGFSDFIDVWDDRAPLEWDSGDPQPVAEMLCVMMSDFAHAKRSS